MRCFLVERPRLAERGRSQVSQYAKQHETSPGCLQKKEGKRSHTLFRARVRSAPSDMLQDPTASAFCEARALRRPCISWPHMSSTHSSGTPWNPKQAPQRHSNTSAAPSQQVRVFPEFGRGRGRDRGRRLHEGAGVPRRRARVSAGEGPESRLLCIVDTNDFCNRPGRGFRR